MKIKLKDIATIRSGIFTKPRLEADIIYLQAKHFDENFKVLPGIEPELILDAQTENHLLKTGDILFAAKGTKNFAAAYQPEYGLCVASSTFLVISLNNQTKIPLIPEFVAWYINYSGLLEKLKRMAKGTSIPSISKSSLEELEIIVPAMEKQTLILKIDELRFKSKIIEDKLTELKRMSLQYRLLNLIK